MNDRNSRADLIDQTTFAADEPLWENVSLPPNPAAQLAEPLARRSRKWWLGLGLGLVVFIVSLGLWLVTRPGDDQNSRSESPVLASPSIVVKNPTHQRILDLQAQLKSADPSQELLPLPPVDYQLRLEAETKR